MPTGGVDYNTRTKEQLIELIEMIQRDRYKLEEKIIFLEQCLDNKEKVNKSMREEIKNLKNELMEDMKTETKLNEEIRKLKNSIEYRKKKADKNQEKANQIDKIMKLPGVMVDGKIDWSKVAVYYMM